MDIRGRNVGGHFHVVPPFKNSDIRTRILVGSMVCVKNYQLNSIFIRFPQQS